MARWVPPPNAKRPVRVTKEPYPLDEAGINKSLQKVAELIREGKDNIDVRQWTLAALKKRGVKKGAMARAKAILEEMREQLVYAPDPYGSELMPKPQYVLGDGENPGFFSGGDCDDLVIAYGSAVQSVGVPFAVVGQSYSDDRFIGHVLGAVHDGKNWFYVDPSTDFEFGKCLDTFSRERIIDTHSLKVICDANVCLRGKSNIRPSPPREGVFVGVDGVPENAEMIMKIVENTGLGNPMDTDDEAGLGIIDAEEIGLGQVPPTLVLDQGVAEYLLAMAADTSAILTELDDAYRSLQRITSIFGIEVFGPVWTPQIEQVAINAKAGMMLAVQFLTEAANGQRVVQPTQGPNGTTDLAIQGKDTDPFWVQLLPDGTPALIDPKTGQQANATNVGLGAGPAVIIAAIVGGVAITVAGVYALTRVTAIIHNTIEEAIAAYLESQYISCVQSGKCTPAEVEKLSKALADARSEKLKAKAVAIKTEQESSPWLKFAQTALLVTGLIGGAWGVYKIYQEINDRSARKAAAL